MQMYKVERARRHSCTCNRASTGEREAVALCQHALHDKSGAAKGRANKQSLTASQTEPAPQGRTAHLLAHASVKGTTTPHCQACTTGTHSYTETRPPGLLQHLVPKSQELQAGSARVRHQAPCEVLYAQQPDSDNIGSRQVINDAVMLDATDGTPSCIDTCLLTRPKDNSTAAARRVAAAHTPLQMTRDAAMTARTLSRGHSVGGTGDKGPRNTPPALHARAHANPSAASCQLHTYQHSCPPSISAVTLVLQSTVTAAASCCTDCAVAWDNVPL